MKCHLKLHIDITLGLHYITVVAIIMWAVKLSSEWGGGYWLMQVVLAVKKVLVSFFASLAVIETVLSCLCQFGFQTFNAMNVYTVAESGGGLYQCRAVMF